MTDSIAERVTGLDPATEPDTTPAPVTLQRLLQQHLVDYRQHHSLDAQRQKVCRHLLTCHTPALGGILSRCDTCQASVPQYHSCRDRHCPQCQQRASRRWSQQQQHNAPPVGHHHLVFTLPHALNSWVRLHPEILYTLLFHTAWHSLKTFAANPKRLGGRLGMTAILHTWGQNLFQHIHLHGIVPSGVLTPANQWKAAKGQSLFPVRALSRHFRGGFVSGLRAAFREGQLPRLTDTQAFNATLDALMEKDWVVYSKPAIHHTDSLIGYLARYSHRIAISNDRLLDIDMSHIRFRYTDYRDKQTKVLALTPTEFIRRFLLHILPKGYRRIRHYGILANPCRRKALRQIRESLDQPEEAEGPEVNQTATDSAPVSTRCCPRCHRGRLIPIGALNPVWSSRLCAPG